jgi:hypothetical protein
LGGQQTLLGEQEEQWGVLPVSQGRAWFARLAAPEPLAWVAQAVLPGVPTEVFSIEQAVKQPEIQKRRDWTGPGAVEQVGSLFALAVPLAPAQPIHQKIYAEKVLAGSD